MALSAVETQTASEEPIHTDSGQAMDIALAITTLEFIRQQLPVTAEYVEDHAMAIVQEFKELSSQTLEQSTNIHKVVDIARSIDLDGQKIPYEQSVEILYEPLAEAITKILQVSKLAMSMVMTIGNAADNITKVESCIDQVQKLTRQTNMLAMNTQIEAARAGEAGKSFRIIAQEVKTLSESIKQISQQIQGEVGEVSTSVKKSSEVVDDLANYDMTDNLELKDKIDGLIESIVAQNANFSQLLQDSAQAAQKTANAIGALVVGIQFQDRNSQILGDFSGMIDRALGALRKARRDLEKQGKSSQKLSEDDIRHLIKDIKLSDVRNNTLQYLYEKGAFDESSEIYQQYLANVKPVNDRPDISFPGDEDDDDIELF